jgi:hypothetical protein
MKGGAVCKFNAKPRAGASGDHARYITRESATEGNEKGIYLHNTDGLRGQNYLDTRSNVIANALTRQDEELSQPRRGGGEQRTHYRCIVSWDRKEETEKAVGQVKEFLSERFPDARAVAAIHQDTEHTHAHIWIDARQIDGKKIHLDRQEYRKLDEAWARTYGRHYGKEYERDHLAKKVETRSYKQSRAQGDQVEKPARAGRATKPQEHAQRERRNYGADESRLGRNQPTASGREQEAAPGERKTEQLTRLLDRATDAARGALQQVEKLRDLTIERGGRTGRVR